MSYLIGIDPGKTGAVGILTSKGEFVDVIDAPVKKQRVNARNRWMYVVRSMVDIIKNYSSSTTQICIEHVWSMKGDGHVGAFDFGRGSGLWEGIAHSHVSRVVMVAPTKWQNHIFKNKKYDGKATSMAKCQELFPDAPIHGPRGGYKDGRADALLIAKYLHTYRTGGLHSSLKGTTAEGKKEWELELEYRKEQDRIVAEHLAKK